MKLSTAGSHVGDMENKIPTILHPIKEKSYLTDHWWTKCVCGSYPWWVNRSRCSKISFVHIASSKSTYILNLHLRTFSNSDNKIKKKIKRGSVHMWQCYPTTSSSSSPPSNFPSLKCHINIRGPCWAISGDVRHLTTSNFSAASLFWSAALT